ncbi:MAG: restriction endonuclease subunit S, partial [Neisseriaceae bacterium]|nr:restriction endonuclease subunit S [Neisseriaceae bacterium]
AEALLYAELGLNPHNPLDFIARHSERSDSVAKNLNISTETKDSSPTAQNDDNKYAHLNISVRTLKQSFLATGRLDSEYYQNKYDLMEEKIKKNGFKTLEEICSLINYGSVPTSPYSENGEGVPYIKGLNLKNLQVNEDKLDRITNTEDLNDRFFTKENDIVISQMGTVGDVGVVSKEQENYIFASFTIRVRLKNIKEFNPLFVGLYIQNIAKEWYLYRNIAQASVRQNTDLPTIKNLYVPTIPYEKQTQIADLLKQSFLLRKLSSELLETAKQKVETAIEQG